MVFVVMFLIAPGGVHTGVCSSVYGGEEKKSSLQC